MGDFGSGIASGVNSVNQIQQQSAHNDFLKKLMGAIPLPGSGGAPLGPGTQGPQAPAGGISLQNLMLAQQRQHPYQGMIDALGGMFGGGR